MCRLVRYTLLHEIEDVRARPPPFPRRSSRFTTIHFNFRVANCRRNEIACTFDAHERSRTTNRTGFENRRDRSIAQTSRYRATKKDENAADGGESSSELFLAIPSALYVPSHQFGYHTGRLGCERFPSCCSELGGCYHSGEKER